MAVKRDNKNLGRVTTVTTEERTLDPEDPGAVLDDELPTVEQDLIQNLLNEVGGDEETKFQVYRKAPLDKAGYCTTYQASELSNDRIQEEFGGGKYQVRAFRKGKFAGSTTVSIIDKKTPTAAPTGQQGIAEILTVLESRNNNSLETVMKMQTELLTALISKPAPATPDPLVQQTNFLAMLASMKDLFGAGKGNSDSSVDILLKGITLGKELGGGGGDTDMLSVLKAGGDLIKPLMNQNKNSETTPVAAPATNAQTMTGKPAAAEPTKPEIQEDLVSKILGWVNRQLVFLIDKAKRDKSPGLYAELLLDNLPPFVSMEMVAGAFAADDALERLAKINPEVSIYPVWFTEFRDEVISLMTSDDEDDEPTETATETTPTGESNDGNDGKQETTPGPDRIAGDVPTGAQS